MTVTEDADLVRLAARNNAELCDHVCRAHGLEGTFAVDAWSSASRTPMFYPDAVTLVPDVDAAALLSRVDCSSGASVKDSFARLDLAPHGFRVLFAAEWIYREADASTSDTPESRVVWSRVSDADALAQWEVAWSDDGKLRGRFPPGLLDADDLLFLRGEIDATIVAGCIANQTANHAGSVVGISNLFGAGDLAAAWSSGLAEVAARFPGGGIVGYESGAMIDAARDAGFRSVGPLRVWIREL